MKNDMKFFEIFRKRGFSETIGIINSAPNKELVQSKFFAQLEQEESYANSYFRVKKSLLDLKIIGYKLNEENEKVIFLTNKGQNIWKKIQEIEKLI